MLVLYVNYSIKFLKFAPKWPLSYFQPILVASFVTIAMVKVKFIPDVNNWAIVLINLYDEIVEKQFLVFSLKGRPK